MKKILCFFFVFLFLLAALTGIVSAEDNAVESESIPDVIKAWIVENVVPLIVSVFGVSSISLLAILIKKFPFMKTALWNLFAALFGDSNGKKGAIGEITESIGANSRKLDEALNSVLAAAEQIQNAKNDIEVSRAVCQTTAEMVANFSAVLRELIDGTDYTTYRKERLLVHLDAIDAARKTLKSEGEGNG